MKQEENIRLERNGEGDFYGGLFLKNGVVEKGGD